jgi:adenylate kinase family enzyme
MVNKIAVIGISGSGKSTFSRKLAEQTGLPLFHMDQLFWKGNWEEVPESEYLIAHHQLVQRDQWIIEGYIDSKMSERLKSADLVIFLDYPGWLCAWWVLKRWFNHRKESRPELPKEALEQLKGEFMWRVFKRHERIPVMEALTVVKQKKFKSN